MYPLIQQIFRVPTRYKIRLKCSLPFMRFVLYWGWGHRRQTGEHLFTKAGSPLKGTRRTAGEESPLDGQGSFLETVMFKLSLMNSMLWEEMGSVYFI